ncbi:MAG: hypothetical protein KC418_16195 [Anaerolineales bacterium]|nr:hypothetical protein [Anaerolineales bacterium]MCB8950888.1 hypothetical protein [Ardenticatenales bacterium]
MNMQQVITDIITVTRKEVWELRHSMRHLYWLLVWLLMPVFLVYGNTSRSLVPISSLYLFLPSLLALMTSGQIVLDTILGEKKAKTLEVLLSTGISPVAIIIGKMIPAIVIGYTLSQLGLLGLNAFSLLDGLPTTLATNWFLIINPLTAAYLASCVVIMTTILIPDERISPTVAMLLVLIPLVFLGYLYNHMVWSVLNMFLLSIGVILFCGLLTWFAATTIKRIPLFTQI